MPANRFPAARELGDIVCAWSDVQADAGAPVARVHRFIPRPSVVLSFQYGDPLTTTLAGVDATRRSNLVGPTSRSTQIQAGGAVRGLTVALSPWGAAALLPMPMSELANRHMALGEVFGHACVDDIEAQLAEAPHAAARRALVAAFLEARIRESVSTGVKHAFAQIVAAGGAMRMRELSEVTAINARQLERRFLDTVGLPPKVVSRLVRLQRAIGLFNSGLAWSAVAAEAGFSDQAHLVREFQAIVGITPRALQAVENQPGMRFSLLADAHLRQALPQRG